MFTMIMMLMMMKMMMLVMMVMVMMMMVYSRFRNSLHKFTGIHYITIVIVYVMRG